MKLEIVKPELEDDRGAIRNFHHAGNVAVIESRAGTVRSNHLHRGEWHWLYVVSGRMRYLEKFGDTVVERDVLPGQRVFTGPGVPHRTEFPVDTVLLSLAPAKTHDSHEADLVRVDW